MLQNILLNFFNIIPPTISLLPSFLPNISSSWFSSTSSTCCGSLIFLGTCFIFFLYFSSSLCLSLFHFSMNWYNSINVIQASPIHLTTSLDVPNKRLKNFPRIHYPLIMTSIGTQTFTNLCLLQLVFNSHMPHWLNIGLDDPPSLLLNLR